MIGACLILAASVALYSMYGASTADAESIVDRCTEAADHASCYEREVPALAGEQSIPDLFEMIRTIRRLDSSYQFCHVLAHKLGEDAVAKDPSLWLDLMVLNPSDGMCSNGFLHGIIVGKFRNDVLDDSTLEKTIPDFARACEPRVGWSPTPLDQAICYHGMGHLFMFITNADITKSLSTCDRISQSKSGNFERVCREGVFMQIYQPLEPDDFALIELLPVAPTRENYRALCAGYDDADEGACLREAWPYFRDDILTGSGVALFCSGQPNADEESACYEAVTTIIGRQLLGDAGGVSKACDAIPNERRSTCYTASAQAFLEEDRSDGARAIEICNRASGVIGPECISTLVARADWIFGHGSEGHHAFCMKVPEEFEKACLD